VRSVLLVPALLALVGEPTAAAAQLQQSYLPETSGSSQPASAASTPARPSLSNASPFLGGVPSGTATAEPLSLTILDAINRALDHNLGVLLSEESVGRARGARWRALGGMLPVINGRIAETRQKLNLAAYGFPLPAGIPAVVGPFNLFDARVYVTQPVLDLRALNEVRAENHNIAAAEYSQKSARDLVVLVAAGAYLQALAAAARVEAARAQRGTAQALYNQASDLKQNGLVAGIDVLRAEVELSTRRQRVTATENDFEKAKLQLARLIGLPIGQRFTLVTELPNVPVPDIALEQALERAYASRPDYQAALARVRAAEASRAAIVGEALPSLRVTADYGDLGHSPPDSHSTFSVIGAINVPIFQGGRTRGRLLEADADLRSRRAEAEDMRAAIYYDVRTAFLDLQSNGEQLQLATRARDVATTALTQARDRFAAGVVSNIEVVQAQEAVSIADEQYIAALYLYNVAKAALGRGVGAAEEAIRQFLGGAR
jgi:outer membrane protein TolC